MFSLANKIALVTGAGSGIGAAISEAFAQDGALVCVTDANEETAAATMKRIKAAGGRAECLAVNVVKEADCVMAAQKVLAAHQKMDVLVNNAGIGCVGTLLQTSGEDMDRLYAVNVRGVFNMSKVFLPSMIERKSGSIINLASIGGVVGMRDRVAYCSTKFAVVGMTKS